MTFLSRLFRRLFPRRPVVVQTFTVQKTDWLRLHFDKHRQLAAELGKQWPQKDAG